MEYADLHQHQVSLARRPKPPHGRAMHAHVCARAQPRARNPADAATQETEKPAGHGAITMFLMTHGPRERVWNGDATRRQTALV